MILEIGYTNPLYVESNVVYPDDCCTDRTYKTVCCEGRIRKTCWFRLGEAMLKLNRPATRRELIKVTEKVMSPDGTTSWGTGLLSPDMWTTFVTNGFIRKCRVGNTFTYELSDWGRGNVLSAQKRFSSEYTKAMARIAKQPKTVAEAKALANKLCEKHNDFLVRQAAGFPKKQARLKKAMLRAEAKILK